MHDIYTAAQKDYDGIFLPFNRARESIKFDRLLRFKENV